MRAKNLTEHGMYVYIHRIRIYRARGVRALGVDVEVYDPYHSKHILGESTLLAILDNFIVILTCLSVFNFYMTSHISRATAALYLTAYL